MKRRQFIASASAAGLAPNAVAAAPKPKKRIAWIAALSIDDIRNVSSQGMIHRVLQRMKETLRANPDLICLPETFIYNQDPDRPSAAEQAARASEHLKLFQDFAGENQCHVVCPLLSEENGKVYNSAVFIDRAGEIMGAYHKMHPTVSEIDRGISPGPSQPHVFQTDIGTLGAQICFDINWNDGWSRLSEAGCDIIFWPSAFPGGRMLNAMAWMTKAYIVTATRPLPPRIIDMNGEELDSGGRFQSWALAPVNLQKAFIHIWPYTKQLDELKAKYGEAVHVAKYHLEDWAIVECLADELDVHELLKEFDIPTHKRHIQIADERQKQA